MHVKQIPVGPLQTNCFILQCDQTSQAVIIDPGDISQVLLDAIQPFHIKGVYLTHGHFDHIGGVNRIIGETGAPLFIHEDDSVMLTDARANSSFLFGGNILVDYPAEYLKEGDIITFGECSLRVFHTPGHSKGSISFYAENDCIIAGDTLFRMSVGRWDFPGGDYDTLMSSIRKTFLSLPDDVTVYPGHGEATTIGFERLHNQFLRQD